MNYLNTSEAVFLDRPNRFVAHVELDGKIEMVHVKNTGRCKELLLSGARVILSKSDNPARKTVYDLIGVYKGGTQLFNIDSQAPNQVVGEWLQTQRFTLIKPEYSFGDSRIDFYMETHPAFGEALAEAVKAGVRVLHLPCQVTPDSLTILDTGVIFS